VVYSMQPRFHFNCLPSAERLLKALNALLLTLCRLTKEVSSGSVVVNDCLFQFANLYAPFGGVGESGMGGYHGRSFFAGGVVCVVLLRGLRALFTAVFLRRCTCISVSMNKFSLRCCHNVSLTVSPVHVGYYSFTCFSHRRPILRRDDHAILDVPFRY
jgi:hypothetical protein